MHWRKAEALRGLSFLTIIILFYLWRRRLPSSYSLNPPPPSFFNLSLSPSQSLQGARGTDRPDQKGNRAGGVVAAMTSEHVTTLAP